MVSARPEAVTIPAKIIKAFLPKEAREAMNLLKGKRTLLGLLITQIPETWNALAPLLGGLGMGDHVEAGFKIVGGIVAVLGFLLKFSTDPEPAK